MELDCFPLNRGRLTPETSDRTVGGWLVTSFFGPRVDPIRGGAGNHGGQDIAGGGIDGQPLYAVVEGTVQQGWDPYGGGNWTTLWARNGARFGYGHASRFAPGVNGKTVPAGTVLAYVGTTGASTGPHLHFAYDSEDAGTSYDDPFDILARCARAGRYPGATPAPPPPTPPEGLTMAQYEDIMASLARIEKAQGSDLNITGQWLQEQAGNVIKVLGPKIEDVIHQVGTDDPTTRERVNEVIVLLQEAHTKLDALAAKG